MLVDVPSHAWSSGFQSEMHLLIIMFFSDLNLFEFVCLKDLQTGFWEEISKMESKRVSLVSLYIVCFFVSCFTAIGRAALAKVNYCPSPSVIIIFIFGCIYYTM